MPAEFVLSTFDAQRGKEGIPALKKSESAAAVSSPFVPWQSRGGVEVARRNLMLKPFHAGAEIARSASEARRGADDIGRLEHHGRVDGGQAVKGNSNARPRPLG